MANTESSHEQTALRVGAGVVLLFVLGVWAFTAIDRRFGLDTDDAYITYRYAQNLASGEGFAYNPGERVLGTTTPLYTLLLAAAAVTGVPVPSASMLFNVAFASLTVTLVFWFLARLTGSLVAALLGSALLLASWPFVIYSVLGMETGMYLLLIVGTVAAYGHGRLTLAAVLAGLAFLARTDGAAVGAALFVHHLAARRQLPPRRAAIGYAVVVVPWLLFAWFYFGDVRPASMLAKHGHALVADRWWMRDFLLGADVLPLWPLAVAALVPWSWRGHGHAGLQALAIWAAMYAVAYTVYRIDLYQWYLSPLAPALAILAAAGAYRVAPIDQGTGPASRLARGGLCVLLLAPCLWLGGSETRSRVDAMTTWMHTVAAARAEVGETIRDSDAPDAVIATGAIGHVGWVTGSPVFDTMGLVTPGAEQRSAGDNLERSGATWFITQSNQRHAVAPGVPDFEFVRAFNADSAPVFFLYRRVARADAPTGADVRVAFVNGLVLESAELRATRFDLTFVAERAVTADFKIFVHIHDGGRVGPAPSSQADFFPQVPTSRMQAGTRHLSSVAFAPGQLRDGALVVFGLFDPSRPGMPRLADADGRSAFEIRYRQRPGS